MPDTPAPVVTSTTTLEKKVVLSVQQIITYAITFVTIGASIYTFFKAIPKIDSLDASYHQLKESNVRVDQRITDLQTILDLQKKLQEKQVEK